MSLHEYKCPCCGGGIAFDSTAQKLKCPYCDTEFELDALAQYDEAIQEEKPESMEWSSEPQEWSQNETQGLRSYVCKSCGGEIVGDATTAATSCPFCGNPVVMTEMLSGELKPDLIIPFKVDKKAAKEALKRHYGGKKLLPKVFTDENHIDEIKGLYVPVWLFDGEADANIRYRGTRVRSWHDRDYDYTETQHFAIHRSGKLAFAAVPVDGSEKMPDELMESIEPFDLKDAVDFNTAYLAGYFADKYDVSKEACVERANDRIRESTEQAIRNTVNGFVTVTPEYTNVHVENGQMGYALYPVWLLNTNWKGQNYQFLMNGQTGKLVGDLPVDKSLSKLYFWKTAGITAAVIAAIQAILSLL